MGGNVILKFFKGVYLNFSGDTGDTAFKPSDIKPSGVPGDRGQSGDKPGTHRGQESYAVAALEEPAQAEATGAVRRAYAEAPYSGGVCSAPRGETYSVNAWGSWHLPSGTLLVAVTRRGEGG